MGQFTYPGGNTNPDSPYYNFPDQPDYVPVWDPSMAFTPKLEQRLNGINYGQGGIRGLRAEATRKGSSPWAKATSLKMRAEEGDARERALREGHGATAEAQSALAMSGGLSSGARERLQTQGMRTGLGTSQDISRQGTINRLGVDVQDAQNRMQALQALPGAENMGFQAAMQKQNAWSQAQQLDIQRVQEENNRRNLYNQQLADRMAEIRAADAQARARENSGKKWPWE